MLLYAALKNEYTCPKETVLQTRIFENLEELKSHGTRNKLKAIGSQSFEWKMNGLQTPLYEGVYITQNDFWVTNTFIRLLIFFTFY